MPTLSEIANMKVGVWNYTSGASGTIDMDTLSTDDVRVITISAIAGATGASFMVDNRPAVSIPANQALTLTPNGTLVNPIIAFVDTTSYVVEYVTNNDIGSSEGNI